MDDIFVLDRNYKKIAIIDAYESLIWTERFNSYGEFELYLIPSSELLETLAINNYLKKANSDTVMIISTRELITDIEDGDHLTVRGKSLESILERRIVWNQTTFQGTNISDAINKLISDSITNPSVEDRKISNFVYDGPLPDIVYENNQVTIQFTGDNLYDAIQSICTVANISFKVVLEDGAFHFKLFSGTDRSYAQDKLPRVLFKEKMENLISTNYYNSVEDFRNVTLVAGAGEGNDRKTYTVGSATGMDRRELYTDARDISDEDDSGQAIDSKIYNYLLSVRGQEKLLDKRISEVYESKMETKTQYEFNKDYFIGDTVELANKYGIQAQTVVSEVVESQDDNGYTIVPTFVTKNATIKSGIPGSDTDGGIDADAMIIAGNTIYKPFVLTTFDERYQQDGYLFFSNSTSGYVEFTIRRKLNRDDVSGYSHQITSAAPTIDETRYSDMAMPKIIYRSRDPIDVSKYSNLHVIYELTNKVWKTVNPSLINSSSKPCNEVDFLLENADDTQVENLHMYENVYVYQPGESHIMGRSAPNISDLLIGSGSSLGGAGTIGNTSYSGYHEMQSIKAGGGSTIIGFVSEYSTSVDKYVVDNSYDMTGYFPSSGLQDNFIVSPTSSTSYTKQTKRINNITYAWGAKSVLPDYTRLVKDNITYRALKEGQDDATYTTTRSAVDIAINSNEKQYIKIGVSSLAGHYNDIVNLIDYTQAADPHKPVFTGTVKKKTYAGSGYAKYDYIQGKTNDFFPYEVFIETKLRIYGMYLT